MKMTPAGRVLLIAMLLVVSPATGRAQQQQEPQQAAPAAPTLTDSREAVEQELARIDVAFRVDGDVAAARQALDALLADPDRAAQVEEDEQLRALRDGLRGRLEASAAAGDGASIDDTVREAIRKNNVATLEELGERAISVLAQDFVAAMASPDLENPYRLFRLLLELAPQQATSLMQQQLASGRRLDAPRALHYLLVSEVLRSSWSNVPGRQPQLMLPEVADLALQLLLAAKPSDWTSAWDDVCSFVREMSRRDAVSTELVDALVPLLLPSARRQVVQLLDVIDENVQWPSVQPLYERLLQHSDAYVRADAAARLSRYRDSHALRACVTDSSPQVRLQVARLLSPKKVMLPTWPDRNRASIPAPQDTAPDDDAEMRSILVTLSLDADPQVREAAVTSLGELSPPAERDVLERLAQDPDPGVRSALATILHVEDEDDVALLRRLVSTGDPILTNPRRLHPMLWDAAHDASQAMRILSILQSIPPGPDRDQVVKSIGSVVAEQSARGRNELTHWALETGEEAPLEAAIDPIGVSDRGAHQSKLVQGWMDLAPQDLARLFPRVARRDAELFDPLWKRTANESRPGLAASMRSLFEDASQPALVRMAAAVAAARELDPTLEAELLAFVTGPALRELEVHPAVELLQVFGTVLPESERNRVLLALFEQTGPPGGLLPFAIAGYAPYAANGAALTEAILRRWGPSCTGNEWDALHKAVEHAGTLRGRLDPQLLIAATRNPLVASDAIDAMCRQRDPVFLPTLAECLQAPWLEPEPRDDVTDAAASAITAYMSDEAARLLLAGAAATSDSGLRKQCLEGAETIRRFQDSMAEWERRDASRATRDDAVTALVQMADDPAPDVRAEALRGLVSLRADEYLPRIIRGLKDEDPGVREAAREALDRHHRLEAEKDEQGGADAAGVSDENAGAMEPKR